MRAANVVYDVPEGRPFWKTTPVRIGVTVLIMVLLVASALMVVVTGGLASHVGQVLGIGSTAVTVWNIAKWPVLLIIVSLMISILYWVAPNAKRGFQWVSPGGVLAVVVWLIASGLFAFYVANFSHYNKTYGSIAGVIVFLIWLWISNIAILFGAEFNAELERGRAAAGGGVPLGQEPYVEPRDMRKLEKRRKKAEAVRPAAPGTEARARQTRPAGSGGAGSDRADQRAVAVAAQIDGYREPHGSQTGDRASCPSAVEH